MPRHIAEAAGAKGWRCRGLAGHARRGLREWLVQDDLDLAVELVQERLVGGLLALPDGGEAVLEDLLILRQAGVVDGSAGLGGLHGLEEDAPERVLEHA